MEMNLKLNKKDGLRIERDGEILERVFIDIVGEENESEEHYNEVLCVSFYDMHQIFIIKKNGTYKLFILRKSNG
jgi:hypothetical protein